MKKLILLFLFLPVLLFGQTWGYTEATNTVVMTGGTSGSPETFADFVTADRAGTATDLLTATAGLSTPDITLTDAVRPVEDLAILIKCIVASKTAEADFIFVQGKDWRGAAQTEALDVTAGNGTYTTTKYYSVIDSLDCSDNGAGGGTQWADGTIQVTQDIWGVIWDYGNTQYQVTSIFAIGDGSTSTYFTSKDFEWLYMPDGAYPTVFTAATLQLGELLNSHSSNGVFWSIPAEDSFTAHLVDGGNLKVYGSHLAIYVEKAILIDNLESKQTTFTQRKSSIDGEVFFDTGGTFDLDGQMYFTNFKDLLLKANPTAWNDVQNHRGNQGISAKGTILAENVNVTAAQVVEVFTTGAATQLSLKNPLFSPSSLTIEEADSWVREQYTVNINVVNRVGTALQSVTVLCEEQDGTDAFSVSTDANGDIAEQTVNYKQWDGTSETLTDFSPHKFTFSKTGYRTIIKDSVTVDHAIDWDNIELLRDIPYMGRRRTF